MLVLSRNGLEPVPVSADICDRVAVSEEIRSRNLDAIVHTAALTSVSVCERDPERAYAVNTEGTKHVADAASSCGVRVLAISTASVFSGRDGNYSETDTPEPDNVYNRSKALAEEYVRTYDKGIVVRINIMGIHPQGSRGRNFMEWLADSFEHDADVSLFSDVRINALSNWTIAELAIRLLRTDIDRGVYHFGARNVLSKAEIGELAVRHFPHYRGRISRSSVDTIADGVPRPKEMWLNSDYTAAVLGVTMPTIEDEVERIFQRYEKHSHR